MDVLRKFGLYLVACGLILAAAAFYAIVVRKSASERSQAKSKIENREKELADYAARAKPSGCIGRCSKSTRITPMR